jgi:hypothetical protein
MLAVTLYVAAFGSGTVHSLGADSAGYVVQIRGAASGIFDFQGSRPGTATAGAFLVGIGITDAAAAPIVMSVALAATLGLVAAAALRTLAGVPAWATGIVVVIVATWGGTARLASGYLANLLSLTLFLLAVLLALTRPGRTFVAVPLIGVACFLAHPALAPVYLAIAVGWAVIGIIRRRSAGSDADDRDAVAATLALVGSAALVAIVVFGPLGLTLRDLADFTFTRDGFEERASNFFRWVSPGIAAATVLAGLLVWILPVGFRTPSPATRLGVSWLAITGTGLALLHVFPAHPGYRTLLIGIPVPMLGAILVVGVAHVLIDRIRPDGWVRAIASVTVLTVTLCVAISFAMMTLQPFEARASSPYKRDGRPSTTETIAGYLRRVRPERPVVLVMNPARRAPLRWKGRLNAVRSMAPGDLFLRTVAYLGDERKLVRGVATVRRGRASRLFNLASARTWEDVEPVLDERPIVILPRQWVQPHVWKRVAAHSFPSHRKIAVIRGPVPPSVIPVDAPRLPAAEAMFRIVGLVVLLGFLGAGWSDAALRGRAARTDRIALAPAFGLAVLLIVSLALVMGGKDAAGPVGMTAMTLAAFVGWAPTLLARYNTGRSVAALRSWDVSPAGPRTLQVSWPALELDRIPSATGGPSG